MPFDLRKFEKSFNEIFGLADPMSREYPWGSAGSKHTSADKIEQEDISDRLSTEVDWVVDDLF